MTFMNTFTNVDLEHVKNVDDEKKFLEEWTQSSRLLFYSVIGNSFVALPALTFSLFYVKLCKTSRYLPYLSAILMANIVLLSTLFVGVLAENTATIYDVIPGFLVCKLTAFLVNTSSCFIHWSWVVMYAQRFYHVFFPLRARRSEPWKTSALLLTILAFSGLSQVWTPIFITGRRLDLSNSNQVDSIYCEVDPDSNSMHSKIIVIIECIITFFVPLILTVFADISVLLFKSSCNEPFILVSNDEIRDGSDRKNHNMKIVSSNTLEYSKRSRTLAIRRCLLSATFTLLLNLPNYCLQLFDEFYAFRNNDSIEVRRRFLRIDAFVYILYLLQFPLTPIQIHFLTSWRPQRTSKNCQILLKTPSDIR